MDANRDRTQALPAPLIAQLDSRDAALWLGASTNPDLDAESTAMLCRLPWAVVLTESSDARLLSALERPEGLDDPLVRRRGLVHLVDTTLADNILPPRHLAVLLLNGRGRQDVRSLSARTRRLTMLEDLRRRSVKQLVVAVPGAFSVPEDLGDLWADGFRTTLTFVSDDPDAPRIIEEWRRQHSAPFVGRVALAPAALGARLQAEYLEHRDGSIRVRIRTEQGQSHAEDAARIDDPEHPVLASYDAVEERVLQPLLPSDLSANEVDQFFSDATTSWRPYAAGMPWERDAKAWETLRRRLRSLERRGVEENRVLYVTAESGSGASTFVRSLGWRAASFGYPTLVARRGVTPSSALNLANFLTRLVGVSRPAGAEPAGGYEAPCLLIFDQEHWDGRDDELVSFAKELERSGRRVCILLATGPFASMRFLSEPRFLQLSNLSHQVPGDQAAALGEHLNRFLSPHGTDRSQAEWNAFFASSSTDDRRSVAAFWIVLSFWLQRQIDLGETVQSRVYRQFADRVSDDAMRFALLRIAAFSTIRKPLPDALLPQRAEWPMSDTIEDVRKELGALGLVRVRGESERAWAMAHDLLGRYLITGLFYDAPMRNKLGFGEASNPEHLRFLILRQISALPILGLAGLRDIAEAFAVSVFKIDPEHGHATFALFWREALDALDQMPRSLRTTSRTFLHHSSVSRRRITSDARLFPVSEEERVDILRRTVDDLELALRLDAPSGSDTDLSLYNSLALALHDLAEAEDAAGAAASVVAATRARARQATREAYARNPDNSFVVETYARNLLSGGQDHNHAAERALEVLTLVYGLMERPGSEGRLSALGRLAERAFELLLETGGSSTADPDTKEGAIAIALARLAHGAGRRTGMQLSDLPSENRAAAAEALAAPLLAGNIQAVKLRYMLAVLDRPTDFALQLELLQSLEGGGPAFTPQMQLEYAVLLFQNGRWFEGDRLFRRLRGLWKRGEHFVELPSRLHWLLDIAGEPRQVRAKISSLSDDRGFARVGEFQNLEVPFRRTQFGQEGLRAGAPLTGYVVFNHNGPLLRPLMAHRR